MHLFPVDKKEHRRFYFIAVSIDPMLSAAAGEEHDLEILLMLMGRSYEHAFAKGFHLDMFLRADLILGWNLLFQWLRY
jgi:hypothetical protein